MSDEQALSGSESDTFIQLLTSHLETAESLLAILELETAAIAKRSAVDIEQCASQKLVLVNRFQAADLKLRQHPDANTTEKDASITDLISLIRDTIERCHQKNDANGEALQRAQLSIHKLRNLFQESTGKQELTYDSEGQASGRKSLGTNIKA